MKNLKFAVNKCLGRNTETEITIEDVRKAANLYTVIAGLPTPVEWLRAIRTYNEAMDKFAIRLRQLGYFQEEIDQMDLIERRDELESHEYKEVVSVTPSGGVSRKRIAA